ncbi:MAG: sodium:solute symporter [Bacteroidota bacterium]
MENFSLSNIDISVMVVYAVFIIGYGLYNAKNKSSEDYFLAGRDMTWPIVGISLFAANISSSTLIGLAGSAYNLDMTVYNYEWYAVLVLVFFAIFFLPFYLKSGVYTMPEFMERRYDSRSRYYFSFITVVGNVLIDTAASLYVGTLVLGLIFPNTDPAIIIVILALSAAAYTIPGGLNSVVKTEVIQAIILIVGSIILTYYGLSEVGGWSGMVEKLNDLNTAGEIDKTAAQAMSIVRENNLGLQQMMGILAEMQADTLISPEAYNQLSGLVNGTEDFTSLSGPLAELQTSGVINAEAYDSLNKTFERSNDWWRQYDSPIVPWWGLLTGVPLLGFYFWANNQFMVQRVLGSKDLNHGRWGALFAGLLKLPVILIMVIPGTIGFLLFKDTEVAYQTADGLCENLADCTDFTYPTLLFKLLPTGLLGLVVAGLLAAMMSSISATFNSASTLITMDFVNKLRPNMTSKQLVRSGQIATLVLVVLASIWAPFIGQYGDLFRYLQDVLGYIAPPIVSAFVVGLFWKRANSHGSFYSLLFGLVMAIIWFVGGTLMEIDYWFFQLHFLLRTTVLFFLCLIVLIGVSLATPPPAAEKLQGMIWSRRLIKEETEELAGLPWYKNYRYLSVILLILTAIVVGYFW